MDAHWIVLCLFTNSIRLFAISIANIGRGLHALTMILQAINFSNLFSLVSFLSYILALWCFIDLVNIAVLFLIGNLYDSQCVELPHSVQLYLAGLLH